MNFSKNNSSENESFENTQIQQQQQPEKEIQDKLSVESDSDDDSDSHDIFANDNLKGIIDVDNWQFKKNKQKLNILNLFKLRCGMYPTNPEHLDNDRVITIIKKFQRYFGSGDNQQIAPSDQLDFLRDKNNYKQLYLKKACSSKQQLMENSIATVQNNPNNHDKQSFFYVGEKKDVSPPILTLQKNSISDGNTYMNLINSPEKKSPTKNMFKIKKNPSNYQRGQSSNANKKESNNNNNIATFHQKSSSNGDIMKNAIEQQSSRKVINIEDAYEFYKSKQAQMSKNFQKQNTNIPQKRNSEKMNDSNVLSPLRKPNSLKSSQRQSRKIIQPIQTNGVKSSLQNIAHNNSFMAKKNNSSHNNSNYLQQSSLSPLKSHSRQGHYQSVKRDSSIHNNIHTQSQQQQQQQPYQAHSSSPMKKNKVPFMSSNNNSSLYKMQKEKTIRLNKSGIFQKQGQNIIKNI